MEELKTLVNKLEEENKELEERVSNKEIENIVEDGMMQRLIMRINRLVMEMKN